MNKQKINLFDQRASIFICGFIALFMAKLHITLNKRWQDFIQLQSCWELQFTARQRNLLEILFPNLGTSSYLNK